MYLCRAAPMCNADMIVINELLTRLHTNIIRLWTFYPPRTPCNIWDIGERGTSTNAPLEGGNIAYNE